MNTARRWTVEILIDEAEDGLTRAVARLDTSDDAHLHGRGTWRPGNDAGSGTASADDLAVAQALTAIADKLSVSAPRPVATTDPVVTLAGA